MCASREPPGDNELERNRRHRDQIDWVDAARCPQIRHRSQWSFGIHREADGRVLPAVRAALLGQRFAYQEYARFDSSSVARMASFGGNVFGLILGSGIARWAIKPLFTEARPGAF